MIHKAVIEKIQYVFQSSTLFGETEDIYLYDEPASIEKYANLCRQRLEIVYPESVVEVFDADEDFTELLLQTTINDDPDSSEVDVVESLCVQVREKFEWQILCSWFDLQKVFEKTQIPIPVLHWLCQEQRIPGTKYLDGDWKFSAEIFPIEAHRLVGIYSELSDNNNQAMDFCMCDVEESRYINVTDFPIGVKVLIVSSLNFAPHPLFDKEHSRIVVYRANNQIKLTFEHFVDRVPGSMKKQWAYDAYVQTLVSQAQQIQALDIYCVRQKYRNDSYVESVRFEFAYEYSTPGTVWFLIEKSRNILMNLIQDTEIALQGGPIWRIEYERKGNELTFCEKILKPLLQKMGFENVRYVHGQDEHGRDFILAEQTKWGWSHYYGIQVKAGDISGKATKSDISPMLNQIEMAFTMPYEDLNAEEVYITSFVIIISGRFTRGAKNQILKRIPRRDWRGSVRFLDQDDIRDLIRKHWLSL
ncbi:MAG: restriction endonuclease [Anaerolineae bacterium]|nr:restriction endonuclease [Anaerolineae bacterium]